MKINSHLLFKNHLTINEMGHVEENGLPTNLTSSGEVCMVTLQTQRPKVTIQEGLQLKHSN